MFTLILTNNPGLPYFVIAGLIASVTMVMAIVYEARKHKLVIPMGMLLILVSILTLGHLSSFVFGSQSPSLLSAFVSCAIYMWVCSKRMRIEKDSLMNNGRPEGRTKSEL
jgi:L-lactate permease